MSRKQFQLYGNTRIELELNALDSPCPIEMDAKYAPDSACQEWVCVLLTPDEARAIGEELIELANAAETQMRRARAKHRATRP